MVKGIDQFRAHFEDFNDRYVLIGGAACFLALNEAGLEFRATKDLDIVLSVEALDAEFVKAFWNFIERGKYQSGKTAALQAVGEKSGAPLVNVNLELSRRMLDLTERQRALQLPKIFQKIAANDGKEVTLKVSDLRSA